MSEICTENNLQFEKYFLANWKNKIETERNYNQTTQDFIHSLKDKTSAFINQLDKSEIEAILLSGSVSRGDYFPEKIAAWLT